MPKTNKQKCLDMWRWLAKNPGEDKEAYEVYCIKNGKIDEYHFCWACVTASEELGFDECTDWINSDFCPSCPIDWGFVMDRNRVWCRDEYSIYRKWLYDKSSENAEGMVKLIKETWEEK